MPVQGKIRVTFFEKTLRNMHLGEVVYMHFSSLSFFRKAVFVELDREVFPSLNVFFEIFCEEEDYVEVRRIGSGTTEDDYSFSFIQGQEDEEFFPILQVSEIDYECMLHSDQYLHLTGVDLELVQYHHQDFFHGEEKKSVNKRDLEQELEEALEDENYSKAAEIRNEIQQQKQNEME